MRLLATATSAILILLASELSAFSQISESSGFKISDQVQLVVLDVAVLNHSGGWVSNLQKNQFKVWDDSLPREITQFSAIDVPVTVGLVVDNSGSMLAKRSDIAAAELAFTHESNSHDQFFVVTFNDFVVNGLPQNLPFTDDATALRKAFFLGKPQGQTALYDAIAYSIRHIASSRQERRALIVVSDGGDNASQTPLAELLKIVEASRATIYTIGLYDANSGDLRPGVLRKIARVSGGEFFEPKQQSEILPVFHQISSEIRHRYTIGYAPAPSNLRREIHTVKVNAESGGRKLKVRTRTFYSTAAVEHAEASPAESVGTGRSN